MKEIYKFYGITEGILKIYEIEIENGRIVGVIKKIHAGPTFAISTETIEKALEEAFKFSVVIDKINDYSMMIESLTKEEREKYCKEVTIVVPNTIKN